MDNIENMTIEQIITKAACLRRTEEQISKDRKALEAIIKDAASRTRKAGQTTVVLKGIGADAEVSFKQRLVPHLTLGDLPHLRKRLGDAFASIVKVKLSITKKTYEAMPEVFDGKATIEDAPPSIRYRN